MLCDGFLRAGDSGGNPPPLKHGSVETRLRLLLQPSARSYTTKQISDCVAHIGCSIVRPVDLWRPAAAVFGGLVLV